MRVTKITANKQIQWVKVVGLSVHIHCTLPRPLTKTSKIGKTWRALILLIYLYRQPSSTLGHLSHFLFCSHQFSRWRKTIPNSTLMSKSQQRLLIIHLPIQPSCRSISRTIMPGPLRPKRGPIIWYLPFKRNFKFGSRRRWVRREVSHDFLQIYCDLFILPSLLEPHVHSAHAVLRCPLSPTHGAKSPSKAPFISFLYWQL